MFRRATYVGGPGSTEDEHGPVFEKPVGNLPIDLVPGFINPHRETRDKETWAWRRIMVDARKVAEEILAEEERAGRMLGREEVVERVRRVVGRSFGKAPRTLPVDLEGKAGKRGEEEGVRDSGVDDHEFCVSARRAARMCEREGE